MANLWSTTIDGIDYVIFILNHDRQPHRLKDLADVQELMYQAAQMRMAGISYATLIELTAIQVPAG